MNARSTFRMHRATCCLASIVVWGAWNAFGDGCPPHGQAARERMSVVVPHEHESP